MLTRCIKTENKIRLCAGFSTGLSDFLMTCDYNISIPEEIFTNVNAGKNYLQVGYL